MLCCYFSEKTCEQFIYISRLDKKEESEELRIKNEDTFLYDHNDNILTEPPQSLKDAINQIAKLLLLLQFDLGF